MAHGTHVVSGFVSINSEVMSLLFGLLFSLVLPADGLHGSGASSCILVSKNRECNMD